MGDSKYDLPVLGLQQGIFDAVQILALTCIIVSLSCAIAVLVLSFKGQKCGKFFSSRTKCERFAVYMAICDGLFNISHFADHLHMFIARNHVHPISLCEFYGFVVFEFLTTQYFIVTVISVNAFVIIRFNTRFDFGKWDWKFLCICFGTPLLLCFILAAVDELGPTGAFCGIHGRMANLFFSTIPQCLVISTISILYALTWWQIRKSTQKIAVTTGKQSGSKASARAAKSMMLFVVMFVVQYWASGVYAVWQTVVDPPDFAIIPVVIFTNIERSGLLLRLQRCYRKTCWCCVN